TTTPAVHAARAAITHLESCPLTNAGRGANLSINGSASLDASMMDGSSGAFGAVGAIPSSGLQSAIEGACAVMRAEGGGRPSAAGRVAPLMLVGDGAVEWCVGAGVARGESGGGVTEGARKRWERHMGRDVQPPKESNVEADDDVLNDTVGAVVVDADGNFASGVSSGGISLKIPGRVG
ncbi:nucleophile aminohydrolase, partial [Blyttiomyces helicus]